MMMLNSESFPAAASLYNRMTRMSKGDFLSIVSGQIADLLKVIPFIKAEAQEETEHSRRFYEYVSSQAELAEEFLDTCGARENRVWFFLREVVAAIRSFAKTSYFLRYLELHTASYELLDEQSMEFQVISEKVRELFDQMLHKALLQLEGEALTLGLAIPLNGLNRESFPYLTIPGKLYADLWVEDSQKEEEAIVKIATSYLEVAKGYTDLGFGRIFSVQELLELVPSRVNEERLRTFEAAVHNLQSVYDTYIQYTKMEAQDSRLGQLRECVATALHLLEIATLLVHFHERHERHARHPDIYRRLQTITGTYSILDVMGNYALFYCTKFLQKGKQLSEDTVMDYSQITAKPIPIPIYRGFHVRPSTYIAKIARHYGADMRMHLGDEVYDASCVFDLFRANEKINMEKRHLVAQKLLHAQHLTAISRAELHQVIRRELHYLIDQRVIVRHREISPEDLKASDLTSKDMLTPEEVRGCMNEVMTRLLALGKIDIIMPLLVTFIGDKRAIHDIDILARTGYGEDPQGNNIPLPADLSYLYKSAP